MELLPFRRMITSITLACYDVMACFSVDDFEVSSPNAYTVCRRCFWNNTVNNNVAVMCFCQLTCYICKYILSSLLFVSKACVFPLCLPRSPQSLQRRCVDLKWCWPLRRWDTRALKLTYWRRGRHDGDVAEVARGRRQWRGLDKRISVSENNH